jgi:hypothetical protein
VSSRRDLQHPRLAEEGLKRTIDEAGVERLVGQPT